MNRLKYNNKITEYNGVKFHSKKEAEYFAYALKPKLKTGEILDIELQPVFILIPSYVRNGKKIQAGKYIADFRVTYKDGRKEIIDVKGFRTAFYKWKFKQFHQMYPDLEIIEV